MTRKEYGRLQRRKWRQQVLEGLGGVHPCCIECGESDQDMLTIDHINNDGVEHRKLIGRSSDRLHREIIKEGFPKDKYQILCANHQLKKRRNADGGMSDSVNNKYKQPVTIINIETLILNTDNVSKS